ncbi:MAG: hypothetical protein ACRDYE_04540 [Acidimicrobiales bacterium]
MICTGELTDAKGTKWTASAYVAPAGELESRASEHGSVGGHS